MSDNAEEGIARAQLAGKDGIEQHQKTSASNLNDRTFTSLFALAFVGLVAIWASATSPYLIYGSVLTAILGVILFGVLRVRRILRVREERERQVRQMQSAASD
jgi:flagellar biogenesis protein FliO